MPVKIKSTSGSVTLDAQNVSGDQTLTVPSQSGATLQTTADTITSSRLSGALPAISGASLTNLPAGGVDGITSASSSGTAINILDGNKIGIGTTGGAGQLDINSGTANTIAKFTSGDDNGFIQIEDNDTTGYVDAQNGWISIGGNASSLHANNLSINVSDGRGLSQFTAKAWVNFTGTGTVAIQDSHNVSSITDHSTGSFRVNFTNALGNASFAAVASTQASSTNTGKSVAVTSISTSYRDLECYESDSYTDPYRLDFIAFGD
jgi:hypothetical protein